MNLKHFMPLLLSLAAVLSAQSDPSLTGGWQVAQVQLPQRLSPSGRKIPSTNFPPAAVNTPPGMLAAPPSTAVPLLTPMPAAPDTALSAKSADPADIHYDFTGGIPVQQLLELYQELVGRTLLYTTTGTAAVPKDTVITLKTEGGLTHSEAIIAMETILGMNGITIVPIGDKFAKVVSEAGAGGAGGLISTNTNNMPIAGKMVTQIIQIKFTDIKDLTEVLKPFTKIQNGSIIALPSTQTLILRDYAENVDRMMEMVKRIDVASPLLIKPKVIKIKYALAADMSSALQALGASGGASVGKSTSGATGFGGRTSSGFGQNGGIGNNSGGGGMNGIIGNNSGGGYPGQGGTMGNSGGIGSQATTARSSFQNNLSRIVQNAAGAGQFTLFGQTKIIADERTNSLLVFANDEDMKMIEDIIDKLDVVLAQVLIDAIVMEINLTGTENTGVSYLSQRQGNGFFTGAGGLNNLSSSASGFLTGTSSSVVGGVTNVTAAATTSGSTLANLPGGFSYFAKFGNDLNVVMEAVAGDSRINVLSRPRIQTSHAVPADLFIGNTVPYVTGTSSYFGSGPSSQYSQLEVGIHLQVLPLINPDGIVEMDIQADVEQLGPDVQITGVGGVPTTTKRQAGAKVAVRDGETILLGGFISDSRSVSDSGIPLLKDIPWLGGIFKQKAIQNLRTELIMLMRPTVLRTPDIAAIVATEERKKLSGVVAAELEIRLEEEARNKKIDAEMAKEAARRIEKAKKEAKKHHDHDIFSTDGATNAPSIPDPTKPLMETKVPIAVPTNAPSTNTLPPLDKP
jgi:general secretion pathway protein D